MFRKIINKSYLVSLSKFKCLEAKCRKIGQSGKLITIIFNVSLKFVQICESNQLTFESLLKYTKIQLKYIIKYGKCFIYWTVNMGWKIPSGVLNFTMIFIWPCVPSFYPLSPLLYWRIYKRIKISTSVFEGLPRHGKEGTHITV